MMKQAGAPKPIKLPKVSELCQVLHKAETQDQRLRAKSEFLPLLQVVRPDVYGSFVFPIAPNVERSRLCEFPSTPECLVLVSGGVGSVAALWRCMSTGRQFRLLFVENLYPPEIEAKRRQCIKRLCLEARQANGWPLVADRKTDSLTEQAQTILTVVKAPLFAWQLCRKSRLAVVVAAAYEICYGPSCERAVDGNERTCSVNSNRELPCLLWGNVHDCVDMLEALSIFGFQHVAPFTDAEQCLFALAEAENIAERLSVRFPLSDHKWLPCTALLPSGIASLVCSCSAIRQNETTTNLHSQTGQVGDINDDNNNNNKNDQNKVQVFPAMCRKCNGCLPFFTAWDRVVCRVPCISLSTEDCRENLHRLPTLRELPRVRNTFAEFIREKQEGLERKKKNRKEKKSETDGSELGDGEKALENNPLEDDLVVASPPTDKVGFTDDVGFPERLLGEKDSTNGSKGKGKKNISDTSKVPNQPGVEAGSDEEEEEEEEEEDDEEEEADDAIAVNENLFDDPSEQIEDEADGGLQEEGEDGGFMAFGSDDEEGDSRKRRKRNKIE